MSIKIALIGATGVMGNLVVNEIAKSPKQFNLSAAITNNPGKVDFLGITPSQDISKCQNADVIIDFSAGDHSSHIIKQISEYGIPYVLCATGQNYKDLETIKTYGNHIPLLIAPNTSKAVNLLFYLANKAGKILGKDSSYDIDILERHHTRKVDTPSGTALKLGEEVALGANIPWPKSAKTDIPTGSRKKSEKTINFSAQRAGNIAGEHQIIFTSKNERLIIEEHCFDRSVFAKGALDAAVWMADKKPGLYSMFDVLDLTD